MEHAPATEEIERLELRTQATTAAVAGVRRAVVAFAELHGVGVAPDVALAVSEAITNAVVHAYRDESAGPVRVVACAEPGRLVVVVRDYGCGMSPNPRARVWASGCR
jgi:anti-sigma regulatory factor (Ser/Thr protein kinase)